jgi:tyrosine-protein kinase Etk/Wzc
MIEQDIYHPTSTASDNESFSPLREGPASRSRIQTLTQLLLRKWLILRVTLVSMGLGLILAFVLPVRYTATTKIMPPKQSQSTAAMIMNEFGLGMGSLADSAGTGLGLKDPNAIYVGLLKSRPVADKLIERYQLMKVYGSKDMTKAREKLEKFTDIESEKSTLISISVTDRDQARAASMANAYTEILRELTKSVSVTEASRNRLFFEQELKDAKENLVAAEVAFQQVQQTKGLVHLDAQAEVIIGSLAAVRADIAQKQVELQALKSFSTEQNPDVQIAERELSAMQAQADQLAQHSASTGFSDLSLKDVPKAGLDYLRAAREVQYRQTLFDFLLKQYEAARIDEAKEGAIIEVAEPAIEPDEKSSPKRLVILILFTFLGLFSGYFYVRWRQWYESEMADPDRARALYEFRHALLGQRFASPRGR